MGDTIAIVGAGIGGLTAALALQQAGQRVRVYEQASQLREAGAGLTLSPNATRVLIGLGLNEPLRSAAIAPDVQLIQHYRTGDVLLRVTRGADTERRYGTPYWQIHRADLLTTLASGVRSKDPDCILLGRQLHDFKQSAEHVTLRFTDQHSEQCAVLVGADGANSRVRSRLFGHEAPQFAGYVVWRGLLATSSLSRAAVRVSAGLYIGPGRLLARYLLRDGSLLNYAATVRRDAWTDTGSSVNAPVAEMLQDFAGFHPHALEILAATPPERCYRWGLFSREPLSQWSRGRVTLVGDAAHHMLPFLGQGANLAIEDALVLARAMAATPHMPDALARYEHARAARATRVMQASVQAGKNYLSAEPKDFNAQRLINEETLGLFDYDAASIPI